MKNWLRASVLLSIILTMLAVTVAVIVMTNAGSVGKVNETVLFVYLFLIILACCIIMTTCLMMLKYTSRIDRMEAVELEAWEEARRLRRIIGKYNELIQKEENK